MPSPPEEEDEDASEDDGELSSPFANERLPAAQNGYLPGLAKPGLAKEGLVAVAV